MTRRVSYLQARFTEPDEFVEDLAHDAALIERGIVRVSKVGRPAMQGTITRVSVHAGAIVADRPVVLEHLIGDLWGHAPEDAKVQARATEVVHDLVVQLVALGLEVRAGMIEPRSPDA
jgi:hypothetical protein